MRTLSTLALTGCAVAMLSGTATAAAEPAPRTSTATSPSSSGTAIPCGYRLESYGKSGPTVAYYYNCDPDTPIALTIHRVAASDYQQCVPAHTNQDLGEAHGRTGTISGVTVTGPC